MSGGPLGGNAKLPGGSGSLPGVWGGIVSPQRGPVPNTFLNKNNSNERRKRVERRTTADPKWFSRVGVGGGGGGGGGGWG